MAKDPYGYYKNQPWRIKFHLTPRASDLSKPDVEGHWIRAYRDVVNGVPGAWNTSSNGDSVVERFESVMYGYDVEDFHKLKALGALMPETPYYQSVVTAVQGGREYCIVPTGTASYREIDLDGPFTRWGNGYSFIPSALGIEAAYTPTDLQYYVDKAAAKIQSSGWDALTFLTELHLTLSMFSNLIFKVEKLTRGLPPERIENLWLEGRYGWRILKYDIQDIQKVIESLGKKVRTRYSESAGNTMVESKTIVLHEGAGQEYSHLLVGQDTVQVGLRGHVTADILVDSISLNPFISVWEVTNFSFIIDWFIGIGSALSALDFLLQASDYQASSGFRVSYDRILKFTYTPTNTPWGPVTVDADIWGSSNVTVKSRTPASVSFQPHIKIRLNEYKIIDLIAIIVQRVARNKLKKLGPPKLIKDLYVNRKTN